MSIEFGKEVLLNTSVGFASGKIVVNERGEPIDFRFIEANEPFKKLLHTNDASLKNRPASTIFPSDFHWIHSMARVGITKIPFNTTFQLTETKEWFAITVKPTTPGHIFIEVEDVTQQIKTFDIYQKTFNLTPVFICLLNFQGQFVMVNDYWTKGLEYKKEELLQTSIFTYIHPSDIGSTKEAMGELRKKKMVVNYQNRYRHADGSYRNILWQAYATGEFIYGAAQDITEQLREEQIKQRELNLLSLLFNQTLTAITIMMLERPLNWERVKNKERAIEYILKNQKVERTNEAFLHLLKANESDMLGRSMNDFFIHDKEAGKKMWLTLMEQKSLSGEFEERALDGSKFWARGDFTNLYNVKGEFVGHFGMLIDITDRKKIELELEKKEKLFRLITDNASDIIWVYDLSDDICTYISPSVFNLLGFTPVEVIGKAASFLVHPEDIKTLYAEIADDVAQFQKTGNKISTKAMTYRFVDHNKKEIWIDSTVSYRYSETGKIEAIGVSRDISSRKMYEKKILDLSYKDQLTKVYNRRYYEEIESKIISDSSLYPISLVMCDVNGLKLVNDVFGHSKGDQLLIQSASLLKIGLKEGDVVARIGGDEFIMIYLQTTNSEAHRRVERIKEEVEKLQVETSRLSISFGVATADKELTSLEALFKQAEDTMYWEKLNAKTSHKDSIVQFLISSLYDKNKSEKRHSNVVSQLSFHLAKQMGISERECEEIKIAGLLHDIGKIGIQSTLLYKKEELSESEWFQIARHPEIGYQILRSVQNYGRISEWVLMHHERPDGKGYPQQLTDNQIPLAVKIISVADAYDSMTSNNVYKELKTHQEALKELQNNSGTQFDKGVVDAFLQLPIEKLLAEQKGGEG